MEREHASNRTLVVLLTIAVSIYLLEKLGNAAAALGNVILLLALAWLLAFTLQPAVEWLHHGIVPRALVRAIRGRGGNGLADHLADVRLPYGLSVAVVFVLVLAVLIIGVLGLVPAVIDQIGQIVRSLEQFTSDLPGSFQRIIDWLNNVRHTLITDFNINPDAIPLPSSDELIRQATTLFSGVVTGLTEFVINLAAGIVAFLSQVLVVLLIGAYILIDGRNLNQQLLHLTPDRFAGDARLWISTIDRTFGGFIRGTLLQSFIYGAFVTLTMLLFGLQYALVVGLVTGVLMVVPFLGGLIGLLVPLLAGLLQASPNTWILIVLLFAFQMILFNLIMPRILSHALRMPTLLVFISLLAGSQLIGVWGLVFAVPLAAAFYSIGLALLHRAKYNVDEHSEEGEVPARG